MTHLSSLMRTEREDAHFSPKAVLILVLPLAIAELRSLHWLLWLRKEETYMKRPLPLGYDGVTLASFHQDLKDIWAVWLLFCWPLSSPIVPTLSFLPIKSVYWRLKSKCLTNSKRLIKKAGDRCLKRSWEKVNSGGYPVFGESQTSPSRLEW